MTLNTRIITDDRRLTLDWINRELLDAPNAMCEMSAYTEHTELNLPGQGFDAWAMVTTAPASETLTEDDDREEPFYPRGFPEPTVRVSLDTAYGYRGPDGEGCSVLHARWIKRIREAFPDARIWWLNEYSDEWFDAREDGPLIAFIGDGDQAAAWFHEKVLPAMDGRGQDS